MLSPIHVPKDEQHFERDPIPYVLDTDWPAGAAGYELLHLMRTRQDSAA
jgi:hypothetical protein